MNISRPSTKEASDASTPSQWPKLSVYLLRTSRSRALANGIAMSNHDRSITALLVLQQARLVDRGRTTRAVDGHDDRQADDDLGGGHDHNEECCQLTVQVAVQARERHKGQIGGIEHQFDAHKHHNGVAASQDADPANGEQQHQHGDVGVDSAAPDLTNHHSSSPAPY